jgi:hypothetical protein
MLQVLLLGPKMIHACKRVDIQAIMRLMDAGADVTLPDLEPEVCAGVHNPGGVSY